MNLPDATAGFAICAAAMMVLMVRLAIVTARKFLVANERLAELDLAALFVFASGRQIAALSVAVTVVATGTCLALGANWAVLCASIAITLGAPRWVIRGLRRRRLRKIAAQLPDALSFWAGLLQSGMGLHPALSQLAERQPRPLGDELKVVVRQCRLGVAVESALHDMCMRVGIPDLRLLSTLLRVSRDLGGNLGESLLRLADLLRSRLAMEGRIRSLTAQGKLQGVIVGVLPLLLLVVLFFMEPQAMSALYREWWGWLGSALIAVLEFTGYLLIRRIVSIDV